MAAGRELSPFAPATPACLVGVAAGKSSPPTMLVIVIDTRLECWRRVRVDTLPPLSPGVVSARAGLGSAVCGRTRVGRTNVLRSRPVVLASGMLMLLRGREGG
jgi:hypothetical protein